MNKNKKILFLSSGDMNTGSHRIWVNDLNLTFKECGFDSTFSNTVPMNIADYGIIICGKNDVTLAVKLKQAMPFKKVGLINLAANTIGLPVDFIIVGSHEEADSLISAYENVFLYPLLERMYQTSKNKLKKHEDKEKLIIGFHGHFPHLAKFEPHLKEALEAFNQSHPIELLVVTTNLEFDWQVGKPNVPDITIKKWGLKTAKKDIMSCDIGVVPNVTTLDVNSKNDIALGLHNTDYAIRFKNKSNAGRCFVFHQLGIPVVADFTPSNMHILSNPDCGMIAHCAAGWVKAFETLKDFKVREHMSLSAWNEFNRLYNPKTWAIRLMGQISNL